MLGREQKGNLMLILAALIWGATFVAQDKAMEFIGPYTFIAARMFLGALTLVPVIIITDLITKREKLNFGENNYKIFRFSKNELLGGALCGIVLFVASTFQQIGISLYSDTEAAAGKSGFITAFYIIFVPIISIFIKKKAGLNVWISVVIATIGMYMLCVKEGFSLSSADLFVFSSALVFSLHILVIDYFSPKTNGIKLSSIQFFSAGILGSIFAVVFEEPKVQNILSAAIPILFAGVLSCAIAYTLQVVAQKYTRPAVASVLMSLESAFAALAGTLFGERLSPKELLGCLLVFIAVILAQLKLKQAVTPEKK